MNDDITLLQQEIFLAGTQIGLSDTLASDLMRMVVARLKRKCPGDALYIPKSEKQARNRQILQMFNGTNHDQVCAAFNISRRTLYRVLGGGL